MRVFLGRVRLAQSLNQIRDTLLRVARRFFATDFVASDEHVLFFPVFSDTHQLFKTWLRARAMHGERMFVESSTKRTKNLRDGQGLGQLRQGLRLMQQQFKQFLFPSGKLDAFAAGSVAAQQIATAVSGAKNLDFAFMNVSSEWALEKIISACFAQDRQVWRACKKYRLACDNLRDVYRVHLPLVLVHRINANGFPVAAPSGMQVTPVFLFQIRICIETADVVADVFLGIEEEENPLMGG